MEYNEWDKLKGTSHEDNVYYALLESPKTLTELSKMMEIDRTTVHYHIKNLEKRKTITRKKKGRTTYFGIELDNRDLS